MTLTCATLTSLAIDWSDLRCFSFGRMCKIVARGAMQKNGGAGRRRFSAIYEKPEGGGVGPPTGGGLGGLTPARAIFCYDGAKHFPFEQRSHMLKKKQIQHR